MGPTLQSNNCIIQPKCIFFSSYERARAHASQGKATKGQSVTGARARAVYPLFRSRARAIHLHSSDLTGGIQWLHNDPRFRARTSSRCLSDNKNQRRKSGRKEKKKNRTDQYNRGASERTQSPRERHIYCLSLSLCRFYNKRVVLECERVKEKVRVSHSRAYCARAPIASRVYKILLSEKVNRLLLRVIRRFFSRTDPFSPCARVKNVTSHTAVFVCRLAPGWKKMRCGEREERSKTVEAIRAARVSGPVVVVARRREREISFSLAGSICLPRDERTEDDAFVVRASGTCRCVVKCV